MLQVDTKGTTFPIAEVMKSTDCFKKTQFYINSNKLTEYFTEHDDKTKTEISNK